MKRLFFYMLSLAAVAACHGVGGEVISGEYQEPFTISADKTQIEASGADWVTFSIKDAAGREITTDMNAMQSVKILSEEGDRVDRMTNRFRAISNGSYTFYATYSGKKTVNTVSLKSVNRLKYEKYHKNVALFKCTGTWCAYCPMMTAQLAKLPEEALKHSVQLCWHGHGSGASDPLAITFPNAQADCANMLLSVMSSRTGKSMGFPTVILDNTKAIVDRSYIAISDAIWEVRADWPATCGIKLSSSESNGAITVNAELNSSTGGEYDVAFALLRDGIYIADGTEADKTYNHVVSAATANYYMYFSDKITAVAKDASKTFSYTFASNVLGSTKPAEFTVVAFALVKDGNYARIDNIVEGAFGETVDFVLND